MTSAIPANSTTNSTTVSPEQPRRQVSAIGAMIAGTACFVFADAMMKLSAAEVPIGESIFVRGIFALGILQLVMLVRAERVDWMQTFRSEQTTLRSLFEVAATFLYISSLKGLPLPIANAIVQSSPLLVTAGAALFLKEDVGARKLVATAAGFAGVLLIVQPGATPLSWALLLVFGAVICSALRDLVTRNISKVSTLQVVASATIVTTAFAALFSLAETWHVPTAWNLLLWFFSAALVLAGQASITIAVRAGSLSKVMPFRYTGLIWSLILGAVIWQNIPNKLALLGMAVIAAAGLLSVKNSDAVNVGQHAAPLIPATRSGGTSSK
jgi:drug/metabolite transporter (DMT)-like permease